jgi:hypothetical protein
VLVQPHGFFSYNILGMGALSEAVAILEVASSWCLEDWPCFVASQKVLGKNVRLSITLTPHLHVPTRSRVPVYRAQVFLV